MTRYIFILLFTILGLAPCRAATQDYIQGKVVDASTLQPILGVVVKALGTNGKATAFTSTTAEGMFKIKVSDAVDSISFKCMGYESLVLPRSNDFSITLEIRSMATQLKDVIVHAPDIYAKGDTLVFNVSKYANASDNAIIDVIKRLPGIKVEEDGTIKYQGKPINKLYLDGDDFIGGQYGLATNNISYKDVKSVEVMENHQPIKALEGIEFPEEAGINLTLKDDAKGKWVGSALAAIGARPWLYDGSLYAMRIAPRAQSIITIRGGNTAWNPDGQMLDHDFGDMAFTDYSESLWPEFIAGDEVNVPLSERRTRDNLSWIGNFITAWKRGDTSMRLKLDYVGDRLDYNTGLTTDYFSETIPAFMQHNNLRTHNHKASAHFNAQINQRGFFLKDKFTVAARWGNSNSLISGSFNLEQRILRRDLSATNDLKLVKRNDKRLFELTSRNSFSHAPDKLLVSGEENAAQIIGTTDFRSTTESRFGKLGRFWKFYINAGIDLNYHRMDAALAGLGSYDNNSLYNSFLANLYATTQIDYQRNGWLLSARLPVKWTHLSLTGQHGYATLFPMLSARKKVSAKSEVSASASYQLSPPKAYARIDIPILSDYRNILINRNINKYSQGISMSISYRYRNPLSAFFANASIAYAHSRKAAMANQLFIGDFLISTFSDRVSAANSWMLSGGASKGLGHSRILVGIDADASEVTASSMRDDIVQAYAQHTVSVRPYCRGSVTRRLSANYDANYGLSILKIGKTKSRCHSLSQRLSATLSPHVSWQFSVGAEHFLSKLQQGGADNLVLLDASAIWDATRKIRLSLTAANLLNKSQYSYITYGTLSRSEQSFRIRPRTILASMQYRF